MYLNISNINKNISEIMYKMKFPIRTAFKKRGFTMKGTMFGIDASMIDRKIGSIIISGYSFIFVPHRSILELKKAMHIT